MNIDLAVVPVAGLGTRLLPLTKSQPKEMLPVGHKVVVQYVAEELALSGVRRLVFVTGPGKSAIENHFRMDDELVTKLRESGQEELLSQLAFSFESKKLEYFYTLQRRQLGLGHAVLCAKPIVAREPFVVALGDSIIGIHAKSEIVARMKKVFVEENAAAVIAFETVPKEHVNRYGIAAPGDRRDGFFPLAGLVEKPQPEDAPSCLAVAARYVFDPSIFDYLEKVTPGKGNEIQLTDAVASMIGDGRKVLGVELTANEQRFDIGNFASYFRAFFEFALADPVYGSSLREYLRKVLD